MRWKPNTIAFWDNRATQHYAVQDYYPAVRRMLRATVVGGTVRGVGDAEAAPAALAPSRHAVEAVA